MAAGSDSSTHRVAVIGNDDNFWLYDSQTGFDLTHPLKPSSPPILPHVTIATATSPVTLDPAKSALVIVDMQNFFLSAALGRATDAPGHAALDQLVRHAIPAARAAGIRIVWLNWGLTQQEVEEMPPAVVRAVGFEVAMNGEQVLVDKHGAPRHGDGKPAPAGKNFRQLGAPCGVLEDAVEDKEVDAGKLLMRDQWNTALYHPLDQVYEEGRKLERRPDVWIHKNRMSGMNGAKSLCQEFLEREGIKTLLFTGVNTDQCVGGTLQDSFNKGFDCILLSDGCGTTSPASAQQGIEFNAANTWGFTTSCKALADGVESMSK